MQEYYFYSYAKKRSLQCRSRCSYDNYNYNYDLVLIPVLFVIKIFKYMNHKSMYFRILARSVWFLLLHGLYLSFEHSIRRQNTFFFLINNCIFYFSMKITNNRFVFWFIFWKLVFGNHRLFFWNPPKSLKQHWLIPPVAFQGSITMNLLSIIISISLLSNT